MTHLQSILYSMTESQASPLKSQTRQQCLLSLIFQYIVLEVLAKAVKRVKQIKGIQTAKKEVLICGNTILYIQGPKDSTRKLLRVVNTLSKMVGYKINRQKRTGLPIPVANYLKKKPEK